MFGRDIPLRESERERTGAMRVQSLIAIAAVCVVCVPAAFGISSVERIRNDKVAVFEETLGPGESEVLSAQPPHLLVYMADGVAEFEAPDGKAHGGGSVKAGQTVFQPGTIRNGGTTPLHFVRVVFLGAGSGETWGMTGLSPNYTMLMENRCARVYDIKIPAQTFEPQHTHHDRVVVSLSGAELEHILPDGTMQPSTLKTGEVVWRLGATHIGHNLGHTDLWVIAIEPK
jgi:hypothetical protein